MLKHVAHTVTSELKVFCVDRAEFYTMKTTESSQLAEKRDRFTGVVLEWKCFFFVHKDTHCYD